MLVSYFEHHLGPTPSARFTRWVNFNKACAPLQTHVLVKKILFTLSWNYRSFMNQSMTDWKKKYEGHDPIPWAIKQKPKSQYMELDPDLGPIGSKKLKQIKRLTSSPCYALHTKISIKSTKNTSISTLTDQGLASKTFILSTSYRKERTNSLKSTTVIST